MSDVGRAALTIGGAVLFGPWGALAGGLIGSFLFPAEAPKGPRLNELNVQRSTVGAPIQIRYGTAKGAGNVIWSGGLREIEGDSGGKGTPSAPTASSFSVDVAIGICDGEDGSPSQPSGIRRIWGDADLLYDSSDDATLTARLELGGVAPADIADFIANIRALSAQLDFTFYNGAETQLPDPTIESYEAVGTVPAFRGLAYVVFNDFNLARFGNRIPNFTIETYSGSEIECGIYTAGHLEPWQYMLDGGTFDPRNPDNAHLYEASIGDFRPADEPFDVALASMNASNEDFEGSFVVGEVPQEGDSIYIHGWGESTTPNATSPCDPDHLQFPDPTVDRINVTLQLNTIRDFALTCEADGFSDGYGCNGYWLALGDFNVLGIRNQGTFAAYIVLTHHLVYPTDAGMPPSRWSNRGACDPPGQPEATKWASFHQQMSVSRWWAPISNYAVTWTRVSGTFKSLRRYADTGGTPGTVTSYPKDPTLRSDDPNYNNQAFWEAAYAAAVADNSSLSINDPNRIPEDWVYGVDYPFALASHLTNIQSGIVWMSECTAVEAICVPMADIVADICRRAGLRTDTSTQIDVSGLTTCVTGYIIGRQMSARDALQPLRMFGLWDAVEGEVLRFVERAGAIVATLTADDLGAHENGSEAPPAVTVSRLQEKELPRRVRLHFANYEHDHEASEQSASRITTEAVNELDVELPISMTPDEAAQLAEISLYAEWVGRNTYTFSLDNDWLHLEPTDCIEIPVEGETQRVRILAVNYKIGGILEVEGQRDDDGSYTSVAVGNPGTPSGGIPGGAGSALICPSEVVLLDIAALPGREQIDTDAGYYAAIYATPGCPSWACAELYRSSDGGETYARVGRADLETTVGEILTITGPATDPTLPGESPTYDTTTSITVELFEGTLASITDAQIAAGQNLAAIGVDGRWVIIQFKTATLDTGDQWTLTDLIWGLNDTQHLLYTTVAGDTFVLLSDTGLLRIAESADAIGVSKEFKIVTCGQSIDAVTEFNFTTWGLSYLRLCPSTVLSATLTTPPSGASDGDAYLLPNDTSLTDEWADHGGEIAHWSDETDSWVYCTPVPGTIIHILGDSSGDDGDDVISGGDGTYTPSTWAPTTATYVTHEEERDTLPNSLPLIPGDNISFEQDSSGLIIHGEAGAELEFQDEGSALGTAGVVNFVGGGVTATVDSSGLLEVYIPSSGAGTGFDDGAALSRSTNQTITAATFTGIAFTSEDRDDNNYADIGTFASGFTIPVDGWYVAYAFVQWGSTSANHGIYIGKNGSCVTLTNQVAANHGSIFGNARQETAYVGYLLAGDTLHFEVYTSVNADVVGATAPARAAIHRLGGVGGDTSSGGGPIALDELTDVTIDSSLSEGDVLTWDGTNGWVNAPASGGSSAGRHSVWISAGAMLPSASGGCQPLSNIASAANQPDIMTLNFDPTTQEYAQFSLRMPKSWNESTVTFAPVWSHPATTTNFGVVWDCQAVAISNDDAMAVAFGTAQTSTDTGGTTNDAYMGPESSAITVGGTPQAEDLVCCRVSRVTGNGSDTMAVDARLHGVTIYMTTDASNDA